MQRSTQLPNQSTPHAPAAPQMGVTFGVSYNFQHGPTQAPYVPYLPQIDGNGNHHRPTQTASIPHLPQIDRNNHHRPTQAASIPQLPPRHNAHRSDYHVPYYRPAHHVPYQHPHSTPQYSVSTQGMGTAWKNPGTTRTFQPPLPGLQEQYAEQSRHLTHMHTLIVKKDLELQTIKDENAALKQKTQEVCAVNQGLSDKHHQLNKKILSAEGKRDDLAQDLATIKKRHKAQNKVLQTTREKLETSQCEANQLKHAYQDLVREKDRTIQSLQAQLIAAQAEILALKNASPAQESIPPASVGELEEAVPILMSMKTLFPPIDVQNLEELKDKFLHFRPRG